MIPSDSHLRDRAAAWRWLVLLASGAILLLHAFRFFPYMADDAFISLRYARRLIDGHGLTWTDGPRVEGYSNLLWVLACAALGKLGLDLVVAARALGIAATLATLATIAWTHRRHPLLSSIVSLGVLAMAGPVAVWAIAGLEQPMVALWLALGVCFTFPLVDGCDDAQGARPTLAGFFFGLLALTRVDGLLFGAVAAVNVLVAGRPLRARLRTLLRFSAPMLGLVAAQFLFRLVYYGDWLPNTGRAKLAFGSAHYILGYYYLRGGIVSLRATFLLAIASLVLCVIRKRKPRAALAASLLLAWLAYVTVVGGDIFVAWRHFVPAIVLAALLIAEGATALAQLDSQRRWIAGVMLVCAFSLHVYDEKRDGRLAFANTERWEWDAEVVGRFLAEAFAAKAPLLAVDPGGAIPYYSGLPAVDMLGLNDRFLAQHPPANVGETLYLGHELGNGPYVLGRKPDLVLFCLPQGSKKPCFRSGREIVQLDGFRDGYQLVTFEGQRPHKFRSRFWLRREDGKIGIQRAPGRVEIPGFLAGDADSTWSHLDGAGKVVTEIAAHGTVAVANLALAAGVWKVTADGESAHLRGRVLVEGAADSESQAFPFYFRSDARGRVDIEVDNPTDSPASLARIVLASGR